MLSKILMGSTATAVAALGIVFWLLMSAKEANGILQQGIQEADDINARQAMTLQEVQDNHDRLVVQIETQRLKTEAATKALALTQAGLTTAKLDFDQRIQIALEGISVEDLNCAAEFVPQPLIDALTDVFPVDSVKDAPDG